MVERLTQRLGNLVNDLLFLARSDSGMLQIKQQTLPLDALLIEVIEEQRTVAQQKDIFLSLHIVEPDNSNEDNFSLLGDWDQLARLFTNLISNGLEHSFSENKNIEKEEQVSAVEVELKKIKRDRLQQLKVKVKDTGKGVPEVALSHLFDRFYQVDPSRKSTGGSGLGLAIAKAIVDNHHGQIKVESELNKGTILLLFYPSNCDKLM
ncbi:two-component sensor histidine kinase [Crocosphaera watsonii WH 0401]|uniref:histidine kinase n=1 Tax=Crocosphaera watsonii WH 0401 TaxID=555881 RepID=T2J9M0_CROWT|nr:two-component sensor histidine kinase [Crocosphaera watsonii WH 0401]